jgi:transposase
MAEVVRGRYSREFRMQAAKMAVEDRLGVTETARCLSISAKTVANWVFLYRQDPSQLEIRRGVDKSEEELSRLRKENAQLRMERDILKKPQRTLPRSRCKVRCGR